ncbi:MAG: prolyl aminopeptidase [Candidatus Krumholzibacteriota bacterium]|nr:prolyl aminopeptidase [Candidatus Krumholzibacteriota bacterium]
MPHRRTLSIAVLLVLSIPVLGACGEPAANPEPFPAIEPLETGMLAVSGLHEIYWERSGNPDGIPCVCLHGGPGGQSSPFVRRLFDPDVWHVIQFDQRGTGRSRPFAETRENTTAHLVADIERLREHLGVERWYLFGGSWGSTLAIAYAEAHPDRVLGMFLRGLFMATDAEIDHFYHGGSAKYYPDAYEALVSSLPDPSRRPLPAYLDELIRLEPDPAAAQRYAREWTRWESRIATLETTDAATGEFLAMPRYANLIYSLGLMENYYMANRCFLEEGQLWRDLDRIRDIPAWIVNGRYDVICTPATAWRLNRELHESHLSIVESAGHGLWQPPVFGALMTFIDAAPGQVEK